jgi:DNA-binding response OmpR family regulator
VEKRRSILLVEDEWAMADVVRRYLERDGFNVTAAADGEAAVELAEEQRPDLVILDLMLPRLDGFEVYRRLRSHSQVPVIIMTARGDETDRVVGLEMGADDYVAKPFSPRELVARVKAVLRRSEPSAAESDGLIEAGDVRVDSKTRDTTVAGRPVSLTAKEFDLLRFFAANPRQVFTRSHLLERVWDIEHDADPSTVTVHIRRLRTKIEADPMRPRYLKTVWGVGYKLDP